MPPILQLTALSKSYMQKQNTVLAVDSVNLDIQPHEFLGLIGESGSGKSTLARLIAGLERPDSGTILLNGHSIVNHAAAYQMFQMVFQSSTEAFNPRLTLGESICEGLYNRKLTRQQAQENCLEYLELCGLGAELAARYPHQVSGGQCQRAAIARALILEPQLIIFDEPTSALDVSTQAQIIELLAGLKVQKKLTGLFISHDIALAQSICDKMAVMKQGQIVEFNSTYEVINNPNHKYTQELLNALTVWC